ncbi:MAG: prepilin peptidase [Desulfovibrionaceae bacterium]|jgi:leader peptidase (prepilin peptidase)/N-methyltransferase|uniref:prepilin peptidase n=1 Tax=Desulfovibrio aminophilus TaxID=81425 RepID=UPI00041330D4|nr:A24 family peptidase [Desulfovibrio aminophilus]MDY0305542.1 prepilin peptidase [Desulfovibrionaceae bacterium]
MIAGSWLSVAAAALLGLALGSFAGCVAHRWLAEVSILFPTRSFCASCGRTLTWSENIPVVSYLLQRGRCRGCGAAIGARTLLIELACGLWFGIVAWRFGPSWAFAVYAAFGWACITAAFIDLDSFLLPDFLTLPAAALAYPAAAWLLGRGWLEPLIGALAGAGFLWILRFAHMRLRKVEGLGLGDVKLMLSIGALVGPMGLPLVLVLAGLTALAASVFYLRRPDAEGLKTAVPFGPFLALGALILIVWKG